MVKVWVIFSVTAVKGFSVSSAQASYGRRWTAAQLFKRRQGGHSEAAIKSWVSRKLFGLFLTLKSFSVFTKTSLVFICCRFAVQSMFYFPAMLGGENKQFNKWNRRKHKLGWNMFISKLGPKQRGREFAGWGEPLSSEALWSPGCQERWEEKRGRGKSQEKVQVTLFFFLETNSGWTQGDARQFTKSQALLSHFSLSKACNLETGPHTYYSFLLTDCTL